MVYPDFPPSTRGGVHFLCTRRVQRTWTWTSLMPCKLWVASVNAFSDGHQWVETGLWSVRNHPRALVSVWMLMVHSQPTISQLGGIVFWVRSDLNRSGLLRSGLLRSDHCRSDHYRSDLFILDHFNVYFPPFTLGSFGMFVHPACPRPADLDQLSTPPQIIDGKCKCLLPWTPMSGKWTLGC